MPAYSGFDTVITRIGDGSKEPGRINNAFVTIDIKGDSTGFGNSLKETGRELINEEMLLRSIRLIIERSDDSLANRNNYFWFGDKCIIDTTGFKRSYLTRLDEGGMEFDVKWRSFSTDGHIGSHGRDLVVQAGLIEILPVASVSHYRQYLLGKIFTQILFALVLILLTASAFVIAYRSLRAQAQLNAVRNDFISNITHELKTPVSTVKVVLESLRRYDMKKDHVKAGEYLDLASQETKRLEGLINKVLDQSFMEDSGHQVDFRPINLSELIQGTLESIKPRMDADGGRIIFVPEKGKFNISGDELYIQGVLTNLIDNSLKYTDKIPKIEIRLTESDRYVCVEIMDNGPGIPEKYHKKIFEKFFRIPSNNIHNVKGYGLGLSFSSLVMDLHQGSIDVRNLEEGCLFRLIFPTEKGE